MSIVFVRSDGKGADFEETEEEDEEEEEIVFEI